jgi:hypothetical protein
MIAFRRLDTAFVFCAAVGVSLVVPAAASTPQSWAQLKTRVFQACQRQSGLESARVTEYWPYFAAHAAATVGGVNRQGHMKGRRAVVLCLYDKHTGTAQTEEASAP